MFASLLSILLRMSPEFVRSAVDRKKSDGKTLTLVIMTEDIPLLKLLKFLIDGALAEANMVAEQGGPAPNPKMLRYSDRSECRLLDVASKGRPLIINFGSCT